MRSPASRRGDTTNVRKSEVIRIIQSDLLTDRRGTGFDRIRLRHHALPEINLNEVDPSIIFMGKKLSFPLLISSMTGGSARLLRTINRRLAEAAEETGVAFAVGSQRVMFTHPAARASFEVRPWAPHTLVFANLGAVQLNNGFGLRHCQEAVRTAGADGLFLHLNPLQEAIQPEGNTNFGGLADRIAEVAHRLNCPVILKEVGAGLSPEDVSQMVKRGIRYFDVAGAGGTSWSRIEHHRTKEGDEGLGLLLQDWGWPTPRALLALRPFRDRVTLIASGGLRSGLDMAKAMILGASLCGMALPFLAAACRSKAQVIRKILQFKREFVTVLFLLGVRRATYLIGNHSLLMADVLSDEGCDDRRREAIP